MECLQRVDTGGGGGGGGPPSGGIVVGHTSPPVPAKLAAKIWRGEFVDLNTLLPHRLGAPEPTLADAIQGRNKDAKQISTIEQLVVCFNAYISVLALQCPQRVRELLGYSSTIVKAAHDYEGTLWLSYDVHFRTLAATMQRQDWSYVDQSLWSQHFNRAAVRQEGGNPLSVGPYGHNTSSEPVGKTSSGSRPKERRGSSRTPANPPVSGGIKSSV